MGRLIEAGVFSVLLFVFLVSPARPMPPPEELPKEEESPPLIFISIPVENIRLMYQKFLPLREYLEKVLARRVELKVAQNYQEAIESIGSGKAHIAYLDPSAYCEARHRFGVIPLARVALNGSSTYRSVIVAREDSSVGKIVDTRGLRLALGNRSSSSSYLIPAVMLKEVGINLQDFKKVDYLEEEDRIALSVLTRRHDVGGLSEQVAAKYVGDGLRIVKTSEAIPQYSVCAHPGLAKELRDRIRDALLSVSDARNAEPVKGMHSIGAFVGTEDRDFDVVRVMIRNLSGTDYLVYGKNSIKVAILPLYSAITLFDRFDPLMRYLGKRTGYEFKLVIPKDFEDFFRTVQLKKVEYSYSNPYIYIQLADGGHLNAFATTNKAGGGDTFRGIIITHRDSKINGLDDLRGKRVMIVSFRSAGGFLAQKLHLLENGIDVFKDLHIIEGKRQEEVILSVYGKKVDAGFVRESALDVMREEIDLARIRVIAETPYIANWPFAATRRANGALTGLVRKALIELKDPGVLAAARITGFIPADDHEFDNLRGWIGKHEVQ